MSKWNSMVNPGTKGATSESNLNDMESIRRLPAGDQRKSLINKLIQDNIPLVVIKLNTYLGLFPGVAYLQHDMFSAGLVALTEAAHRLSELDTPEDGGNPSGFIGQAIIWAMGRVVENEARQAVPKDYYPPHQPREVDPREIIFVRDLLSAACQTDEDRIIIEMRERGCKDHEIASRLCISRTSVRVQRHELMLRYLALHEESQ
jgi:hypothetical protein